MSDAEKAPEVRSATGPTRADELEALLDEVFAGRLRGALNALMRTPVGAPRDVLRRRHGVSIRDGFKRAP